MDIFSNYGTVQKVGKDVEMYDWKTETSKFIRSPGQWHFAFSKMKRMIITKNTKGVVLVRGEGNFEFEFKYRNGKTNYKKNKEH